MTKAVKKNSRPPAPARPVDDPIFAAIAERQASVQKTDRLIELAELRGMSADLNSMVHDALRGEIKIAKALIGTPPTTRAGLRALEEYLRRNDHVWRGIERTVTTDEGYTYTICGGCNINWLIAKRAAEIGSPKNWLAENPVSGSVSLLVIW